MAQNEVIENKMDIFTLWVDDKEMGIKNFADMIADETVGITEDEILPWLQEKNHPALSMDPLIG